MSLKIQSCLHCWKICCSAGLINLSAAISQASLSQICTLSLSKCSLMYFKFSSSVYFNLCDCRELVHLDQVLIESNIQFLDLSHNPFGDSGFVCSLFSLCSIFRAFRAEYMFRSLLSARQKTIRTLNIAHCSLTDIAASYACDFISASDTILVRRVICFHLRVILFVSHATRVLI